MKMKRSALAAVLSVAALAVAVCHASPARASGSVQVHGLTFPTGTNGCTGPLVPIYGEDALKAYILAEAASFCAAYGSGAPDVEYADGGTACTGVDWAADFNDNNEIGLSDVFVPSCTGSFGRDPSRVADTELAVNVVEAIAQCGAANEPQGGGPHPPAGPNPCSGSGGANGFAAPNDESVNTAQLLWNGTIGDYVQVGGVTGVPPTIQQRVPGSGTRITWCYNINGSGNDLSCVNTSPPGPALTTGAMLNDVCGNPYAAGGPTSPVDPAGTIGYASHAAVTRDPRQPAGGQLALAGCGLVGLGGYDGYNRDCDPTDPTTSSYTGMNPESNVLTCQGDLQVALGHYPAWGYEHLDVNASGTTTAANQFINYLFEDPDDVQEYGFMQPCQLLNTRSADGGPYTASPGAAC